MTVNSSSLLQRLQELQQQIADATRCGSLLQEALKHRDYEAFLCASRDAERHVETMAIITGDIKGQVVPADGLGDALESLSELVLRTVRMVVLTELSALRDAVGEPSARGQALVLGPFRSVDDLTASVGVELSQITDRWRAYRGIRHVDRASYRAGLRVAHASMRELGNASGAARCLRDGLTRTGWPAVQEPTARIVTALAIRYRRRSGPAADRVFSAAPRCRCGARVVSGARVPRRPRDRHDTRPDTPTALRENAADQGAAGTASIATALTPALSPEQTPGKAGTR